MARRPSSIPNVALQGEHGSFSELAAVHYFGSTLSGTLPCKTFEDVFRSVQNRTVHAGIIPIENSLFGSIHQNYDLLQRYPLRIVGEIMVRISHSLLALPGVSLRNITHIYSHPQALGQCEAFLKSMKHVEAVPMYDTAGAAKMIKEDGRRDAAAIASSQAATMYGLRELRKGIESDHHNFTRFLVLSRENVIPKGKAKTSLVFSTKDIPGALFKALSVFALRDINLHKIESRPMIGKPWEYLFYVDFEGTMESERSRNAIRHLEEIASYMKILGCYPVGKTVLKGSP